MGRPGPTDCDPGRLSLLLLGHRGKRWKRFTVALRPGPRLALVSGFSEGSGAPPSRFEGLDLIECLKNYGWRFITLYKRW